MDASTKPILVNREQAVEVAQIFMRHPHIHGVELFGRTAREGQGNDLDLILVTDEKRGTEFIEEVKARLDEEANVVSRGDFFFDVDGPDIQVPGAGDEDVRGTEFIEEVFEVKCSYNNPILRYCVAQQVLGNDFRNMATETGTATKVLTGRLDLFVFPLNWRERLDELQDALPHPDPHFMENIARDAVKIA